jgi:hypothetical protein
MDVIDTEAGLRQMLAIVYLAGNQTCLGEADPALPLGASRLHSRQRTALATAIAVWHGVHERGRRPPEEATVGSEIFRVLVALEAAPPGTVDVLTAALDEADINDE